MNISYKVTHIDFGNGVIKEIPSEGLVYQYPKSGNYIIKVKAEELGWVDITDIIHKEDPLIVSLGPLTLDNLPKEGEESQWTIKTPKNSLKTYWQNFRRWINP